ncbi:MAG: hypothetical protein ACP5T5_06170 [Thermoprotei archaeon]
MKFDLIVRQTAESINGVKKVTLEGKNGFVTMDEPEKLFSLKIGDQVMLNVNEGEEGFYAASYLPVYKRQEGDRISYLYSAYGLLIKFEGDFNLPYETIKVTLTKP